MSGPFKMNKPVIKGTKAHSALLATAKTEQTRTHGGDPSLVEAAALYGASNSPDVIDFKIKQAKIKWDKDKGKDKEDTDDSTIDTKSDPNKRKRIIAEKDKNKAINKLIIERERWDNIETTKIDPIQIQPIETPGLKDEIILPKKREKIEVITSEPPKVQSIGGESVHSKDLKTSYTEEEQKRLIFSEKHGRMVLPEEIGIVSPPVVVDKKLDKKLQKAEEKGPGKKPSIKVESQKTNPPAHLRREYKKASQWQKWQMEKKYKKYQF